MGAFKFEAIDGRQWGKSAGLTDPYPVLCHMLDVAAVAGVIWDQIVPDTFKERLAARIGLRQDQLRCLFLFWAGAHDLGKISPEHQKLNREALQAMIDSGDYPEPTVLEGTRLRHDKTARLVLGPMLEAIGYSGHRLLTKSPADQIAQVLGGHHGTFHDFQQQIRQPGCGTGPWALQRQVHLEALRHFTGATAVLTAPLAPADLVALCGWIVMADWLASPNETFAGRQAALPPEASQQLGRLSESVLQAHWADAVATAPTVVAAAGVGAARLRSVSFAEAFPKIKKPYPLQTSLAERLPGRAAKGGASLLVICAPPGDGKTEAGCFGAACIGAAAGSSGIYFALPTMSTADALYPRMRQFVAQNATGATDVTLAHSMDVISKALRPAETIAGEPDFECDSEPPSLWLQQGWRRLMARFTVGTIDQVLAGVLPAKYNMLRLSGLTGKTLIVDEAHAYGPWMHFLLQRLLEWCAALGVPVVLMSATLSGGTALPLVNAFRRGLGQAAIEGPAVPYPGWLHSAADGTVTVSETLATERATRLSIQIAPVRGSADGTHVATRQAVLDRLTERVATEGGRILVVCATVEAAQRTWDALAARAAAAGIELGLLHSRVTSSQRESVIDWCESRFGKRVPENTKQSTRRQIIIATSIVEQSLDWDFDLVVSDLAPLALLLQRAGRCHRHLAWHRPAWLADGPRLIVLDPVDDKGAFAPPREWGKLYPASLLRRTRHVLTDTVAKGIAIPEDVQDLIDRVYAADFAFDQPALAEEDLQEWRAAIDAEERAWTAGEMNEASLAGTVAVPAPSAANNLARLSGHDGPGLIADALVTTRLGADAERVVCAYTQPDGTLTLDPAGTVPLPGTGRVALSDSAVRALLGYSLPVPASWLRGRDLTAPGTWAARALTRHLGVLRMTRDAAGWSNEEAGATLEIDDAGIRGLARRP
jgi:CRISPR-associated endonuclease/helicase Cas3